jgi:hypothetical protein
MVNSADACGSEKKDILEICPNWALDEMKEKTRFMKKGIIHLFFIIFCRQYFDRI